MTDALLFNRGRKVPGRRITDLLSIALAVLGVSVLVSGLTGTGPSSYFLNLIGQIATFGMLAIALDLIWGYAGILSLGHGLFFAVGGYVIAMHMVAARPDDTG